MTKGVAGGIIIRYSSVQPDDKSPLSNMTMIDKDEYIQKLKEITDTVHECETPIIMQIAHSGRQTRSKGTDLPTVAPSAVGDKFYNEDMLKALSADEINIIIDNLRGEYLMENIQFIGYQIQTAATGNMARTKYPGLSDHAKDIEDPCKLLMDTYDQRVKRTTA